MDERMKLNDLFPAWANSGGIMTLIIRRHEWSWETDDDGIPPYALDLAYHGNRSGDKYISPLVEKMYVGAGGYPHPGAGIPGITRNTDLADLIIRLYGDNWEREYATYLLEYNPIENYSMTEDMTGDVTEIAYGHTRTRTDNLTHTKTGTETDTPATTQTATPGVTTTTEKDLYGFNSAEATPADKTTQSMTGQNTVAMSGTDTTTYNTTDADTGTQTDAESGTDTHTRNYELTRKGNIGVTTSQQMIQSERELWMWRYFDEVVFPDLDRVLTIQIY